MASNPLRPEEEEEKKKKLQLLCPAAACEDTHPLQADAGAALLLGLCSLLLVF